MFEDSVIWDRTITPTRLLTVECRFCEKTVDLADPEHEAWDIMQDCHDACLNRDPNMPDDPDWRYEEGLL